MQTKPANTRYTPFETRSDERHIKRRDTRGLHGWGSLTQKAACVPSVCPQRKPLRLDLFNHLLALRIVLVLSEDAISEHLLEARELLLERDVLDLLLLVLALDLSVCMHAHA